ncbi:MAG: hypothetical protein A3F41_04130 [Coxiella sp. RIFCSPHIGHO2_12_FULL_44_14]|nr:MAG: hypothetical protein A3F41_04130 [Coxiella sp. RIFCSPHIGHO2_12_FULL_44_14]
MQPDQRDLLVFHQVALNQSFTKAAVVLAVSKGYVSRVIRRLEHQLEKKLLQRSTRQLVLTDAGEQLFSTTQAMQATLEKGLEALQTASQIPKGLLRISAPPAFAEVLLAPIFAAFQQQYPAVIIEIDLQSRLVDPIAAGYDLIFRSARLSDSNLIARKLFDIENVFLATPEFLQQHHPLKIPQDLKKVPCVAYGFHSETTWHFSRAKQQETVTLTPVLKSNLLSFLKECALNHLGVVALPLFMVKKELAEQRLHILLPEWQLSSAPLYMVYPSREYLPFKVKCLIEFLTHYSFQGTGAFKR